MLIRLSCLPLALACAVLGACGGGGDTSNTAASDAAQSQTDLVIKGAAATGAALPNARIEIKCASGTGNTASATDGTFTVTVRGGSLPCAIRATSADNSLVLHSALESSASGSLNANVTPMTELIVAQAQGTSAALMFDQFESNRSRLSQAGIEEAKARVKMALASIVDLNGTDPIKDLLVPAVGNRAGNDLDKKLDALRDRLAAADVKVQDLSDALTSNTEASVGEVIRATVRQRSFACKGVRTGTYRLITAGQSNAVSELSIDAATLIVTTGGVAEQWTAEGCTLSSPGGVKMNFGVHGVGAVRVSASVFGVVMPKQDLGLTDLAGSWSWVRRHATVAAASSTGSLLGGSNISVKGSTGSTPVLLPGGFIPVGPAVTPVLKVTWGEALLNRLGVTQSSASCDTSACTALTGADLRTYNKAADGGFVSADGVRQYMFRAPGGASLLVGVAPTAGDTSDLMIGRRGHALRVPRLNSTFAISGLSMSAAGATATDFSAAQYKVISNDHRARTFTRSRVSDCQTDTWSLGKPFAQMVQRQTGSSASCTDASTAALAVSEARALSDQGLGFAALVSASERSFALLVTQPKLPAEGEDDDLDSDD